MKGKLALVCPPAMVTLDGTVSGAWALREIVAAAVAAVLREATQAPEPLLGIDVGKQISDVN